MHTDKNQKQIKLLNELLTKNYDAEKGYEKAQENVDHVDLKNFFEEYVNQRYRFGHELKDEIHKLGGKPDKGASTVSSLHRTWIDIKGFFTGKDESAILEECEKGEKATLEDYAKAIKEGYFTQETEKVLLAQHQQVKDAIDRIENIKTVFKTV